MLAYATIGVKDMDKAKAYYSELLAPLGASILMDMGRIALFGTGMDAPMIGICIPHNEQDQHPGNGNMLAIPAGTRENVDALHAKALEMGGSDEGEPGERGPGFYGGYCRDPDGNKLVFCVFG